MTAQSIEPPLALGPLWRRYRTPIVIGAFALLVVVVVGMLAARPSRQPLDPRDATGAGARALAALLHEQGVAVELATTVNAAALDAQSAVLVADPASLSTGELTDLAASPARLVLLGAGDRELHAVDAKTSAISTATDETPQPQCLLGAAAAAGDVRYDGVIYARAAKGDCYPLHGGVGLLVQQRATATTVLFGSSTTFDNKELADRGNAALALGLLSQQPRLIWLLPRPAYQSSADQHRGLFDLLPARLLWALLQLSLAVVVLALWRARRLGPVVVEPLPVVVRSAETVEGRARLLRAAQARGTAAASLRTGARTRLGTITRLGADPPQAALVHAVSERVRRSTADVSHLLYGPDPTDDKALMALAADLNQLEREVRTSD
jgi:hypothetical protein